MHEPLRRFRRRPKLQRVGMDRNVEDPETIKEILDLVLVPTIGHRVGKKDTPSLGREADASRHTGRPDEQRTRERPFENKCRVISFLFQ